MSEQWRDVLGYEGLYQVSDQGRVRGHFGLRKLHTAKYGGYPSVGLCRDGLQRTWTVHRLVMEAFVGPLPEGMEICHGDGNAGNSKLTNLRYDTSRSNKLDQIAHGRHASARKTHCPKGHAYTPENVYVLPSRPTARYCRACHRERMRKAA